MFRHKRVDMVLLGLSLSWSFLSTDAAPYLLYRSLEQFRQRLVFLTFWQLQDSYLINILLITFAFFFRVVGGLTGLKLKLGSVYLLLSLCF